MLPLIRTPTLVIATNNRVLPAEHGRYLAERITGARFVELATKDATPLFEDTDETIGLAEEFLTGKRGSEDPNRRLATVLFTDMVESSPRAVSLGDRRWRQVLDEHDRIVRDSVAAFGGQVVKLTGDGAFIAFDGPAKAIRCTTALRDSLAAAEIEIRSGLHTGEVEIREEDISGITVHIAARIMAEATAGQILVSSTVKDLVVGSGIVLDDRGARSLKGIPDTWGLYAVESV